MTKLQNSVHVAARAEQVWAVVGDLAGVASWIQQMPLKNVAVYGEKRVCALEGGGELVEHIFDYSDEKRAYSYTIDSLPWPVEGFHGRFAVHDDGDGSKVVWDMEFQPGEGAAEAEIVGMLDGIQKESLVALRRRAEEK